MNPEDIRLLDPDLYSVDPYPTYAWLRDHSPVHWDARHKVWGISRFDDIVAIEKNPERYTSSQRLAAADSDGDPSMINTDDPAPQRCAGGSCRPSSRPVPSAARRSACAGSSRT